MVRAPGAGLAASAPPVARLVTLALVVVAALAGLVPRAVPAEPAARALTIDDVLAMRRIGNVALAAGGRLVIYEQGGIPEGFADFGIDDPSASGRIYVFDRDRPAAPRRLLDNFAFPNWIGALSPGGLRLAVFWWDGTRVKAGSVDLRTRKLAAFDFNPTYDFSISAPIWIDDRTLLYSTEPAAARSPRIDFRRRAATTQSDGWQHAWHGEVSASVLESKAVDFVPEWRPGTLLKVDAGTGKAVALADGKFVEMSVSADHRYLAAARQGRTLRFAPDSGKETYDNHRLEPVIIDLQGRNAPVTACQRCQLSGLADFGWSATGHRVSFFIRFGLEPWEHARFRIFDADTGALQEIRHVGLDLASQRENTGMASAPVIAIPFGIGALLPARKQADPKAEPIFTFKEPVSVPRFGVNRGDYAARLGRLDWYFIGADGTARVLTSALDNVQSQAVGNDRRGLYFMAGDKVIRVTQDGAVETIATLAGQGYVYKLEGSVDDGGPSVAVSGSPTGLTAQFFVGTSERAHVTIDPRRGFPLAMDARSGTLLLEHSGADGTTLTVLDSKGAATNVTTINEHLRSVAPAKQVTLNYTYPSGESTQACLLLPPGATAGKPLPTIVSVYPVEGRCRPGWRAGLANTYDDELFTGFGYAVLTPSTPARLLQDGANPVAHWGTLVEAAVDAGVKDGYIDRSRLGAWGMSLGGHSVLSTLSQTRIFRAGAAANGAADFFSNYASLGLVRSMLADDLFAVGHASMYEEAQEEGLYIGAPPWVRPDAYAAASPLANAGLMNTPLLLMAGDLDWDYQMTEFDQYYVALLRQGKEAVYVRYLGEGHGNFSPANVRDAWDRLHRWFDSHLLGQ